MVRDLLTLKAMLDADRLSAEVLAGKLILRAKRTTEGKPQQFNRVFDLKELPLLSASPAEATWAHMVDQLEWVDTIKGVEAQIRPVSSPQCNGSSPGTAELVAPMPVDVEQQELPGIIALLGELKPGALLTEAAVGRLFNRHSVSIKRAVQRGELPAPCRLFGGNTWTAGVLIRHLEKRLERLPKKPISWQKGSPRCRPDTK